MLRWLGVIGLLATSVLGEPEGAFAQPPAETESTDEVPESTQTVRNENLDQAARLTFESAREAFSNGNYELALERFQQAYQLSPRPALLYNLGVTLDRLRRDEEAVARFSEYLERVPDAPDRVEVEARVRVLRAGIDRRHEAEEVARREQEAREAREAAEREAREAAEREARESHEAAPARSSGLHPAVALAVGGAALAVGGLIVWSGLDARSRNDDYEAYTQQPDAVRSEGKRLFDRVGSAETRTNALIGVASGLAVTAVVLAIFSDWSFGGDDEPSTTAFGGPTRDGFVLGATHRF